MPVTAQKHLYNWVSFPGNGNVTSDVEQSTIPTEFTEFVHSAFDKMGVKMDNIITGQQALEIKLDLVNQQVQSNKGEIEQLKKTADFVSEQLTKATCVTKENAKKTADIDKDFL